MQNKEKCLHATPLSETVLIPTIQIREGRKSKGKKERNEGGKETKRGEGRLEGKGEGGWEAGGGGGGGGAGREGLHLKMLRFRFIRRQI